MLTLKPVNALPAKEQEAIVLLTCMKVDEYITWSLTEDEELMMQTLHLVITYEEGKQCRLNMPDCIRQKLMSAFNAEPMDLLHRV